MKTLLSIIFALMIGQIVQAGTVSGTVLYQGDSTRPINNVVVTLKDTSNNLFATFTTGPDGYYEFLNVPAGTYQIKGIKNAPGGGVNMIDAVLVLLHVMGFYPFNDIQTLAADVTGNGHIEMADYYLIKQHILRHAAFPVGEWVFLNETIQVTNLKDSHPGGLTGSSAGDVGGVFVPGTRGLETYPIAYSGSLGVSPLESFAVQIRTLEDINMLGTGLVINFPTDLINITSVEFPFDGFEYEIEGNQIKLAWNDPQLVAQQLKAGDGLVTLNCTANANFTQGMSAKFSLSENTGCINADYESSTLKLESPTIEYAMPSLRLTTFPNPFSANTTLSYYLPSGGNVTIAVYDQNGRAVKEYNLGEMAEGHHTLQLEGSGMTPGNYYCKINQAGMNTETIRILKNR